MVFVPHPQCADLANREVRKAGTDSPDVYWQRVRETMPKYFWNRILQDEHGRCEWCNEPMEAEKKS